MSKEKQEIKEYQYEYKGNVYKLKDDVMSLYRDGIDLISRRKELMYKHTKTVDRKIILEYETKVQELNKQKLGLLKKKQIKNNALVDKIDKEIIALELTSKLDSRVSAVNYHMMEKIEDALLEMIADKDRETIDGVEKKRVPLFPVVFPKILDGDAETFNFNDIEFAQSVTKNVIADFFFVMTENRVI